MVGGKGRGFLECQERRTRLVGRVGSGSECVPLTTGGRGDKAAEISGARGAQACWGALGITKCMETRRNFNHFLPGPGARFKAMREKFLEGTLPVGPGWAAAPVPHLLLVIPAQTGSSKAPDPSSPWQPRATEIPTPGRPVPALRPSCVAGACPYPTPMFNLVLALELGPCGTPYAGQEVFTCLVLISELPLQSHLLVSFPLHGPSGLSSSVATAPFRLCSAPHQHRHVI
jgi:hypothetical protein